MVANKKEGNAKGRPPSPKATPPSTTPSKTTPGEGSSSKSSTIAPTPRERAPVKTVSPPEQIRVEPSQAPQSLIAVVAAASAAAPPAIADAPMRPPLASDKRSATNATPAAQQLKAPLTFAQAASGAVPKANRKASTQDVVGKYIAPRPNPPEAQLRNRNEKGLQDLFHKRWHSEEHGVCFENVRGVSSERYLEAISKIVPLHRVFAMGPMGQGTILVTLNSVEAANELLIRGIEVAGRHLIAYPEARRPQRVVLSPIHPRVDDQCLMEFLGKFGKVQGRIRGLPLRLGEKGLARGIFSLSREAFITLNPGVELPPGFRLVVEGSVTYVELATETRCYGCRQVGHLISRCPKRAQKECAPKESTPKEGAARKNDQPPLPQAANASAAVPATDVTTSDEEVSADGSAPNTGAAKKRRRRRKRTQPRQEEDVALMPPPKPKQAEKPKAAQTLQAPTSSRASVSGSDAEKRRRSDDGEEVVPAPKAAAVSTGVEVSDLSDVEVTPIPRSRAASGVGYETDASVLSIGSGAELEDGPLKRSQLRDLIKKVSSKRNMEVVKGIVRAFTTRYYGLIVQLQALAKEAKEARQYNQEAKLGRIISKIEEIALEDDTPRPEER